MSISRHKYLATISARLRDNPVVSLLGPRQVGKTTLAKNFAEGAGETHFFDLESPSDLARLANPELVLSPLHGLVVLDEIQRMPELFPLLLVLADRPGTPAKFLILGSASSSLVKGAGETLAGILHRRIRVFSHRNWCGRLGNALVAGRIPTGFPGSGRRGGTAMA